MSAMRDRRPLAPIELVLLLLTPFRRRLGERQFLGHIEPDLPFDDLAQRDVSGARVADVSHERPAHGARAGRELPHPSRNQVDQNVGVPNLRQSLSAQFAIQEILVVFLEPVRLAAVLAIST